MKKLLLLFCLLLSVAGVRADDFVLCAVKNGLYDTREYQLVTKFGGINYRLHISESEYTKTNGTGTAEVIRLDEVGYNEYSSYFGALNGITSNFSGSSYSGDIVIPASVSTTNFTWGVGKQTFTFTVDKISGEHDAQYNSTMSGAFQSNRNITSVTLPSTITSLPDKCFQNCTGLTNYTVPSTLSSIGTQAFDGCTNLKVVVNNNSNLSIQPGQTSYGYVAKYADYVITGSSIAYRDGMTGVLENGIVYKDNTKQEVIRYNGSASSVTLPSTVLRIAENAFAGNTTLTSISLPSSLCAIRANAFAGCTGLTSIALTNTTLVSIGTGAFMGCTSLTSFSSATNNLLLGAGIFEGCTALRTVNVTNYLNSIPDRMFKGCINLTAIYLNNALTRIGASAFEGCEYFSHPFSLRLQLASIGDRAFKGTRMDYETFLLPATVTEIGEEAFAGCIFDIVQIQSSPTIGAGAFSNCPNLKHVKTVTALNTVPDRLFSGCPNFTSIGSSEGQFAIAEGVTRIGHNAFMNTKLSGTITLPSTVTEIGYGAFGGCAQLTGVNLPSGLQQIDGEAFSKTGLTSISIPASVERFGDQVFSYCRSLTTATLPDQLKEIPTQMFWNCSALTSVNIPSQLEKIGRSAFNGCSQLTDVTLPWSLKVIDEAAFFGCTGLTEITIPNAVDTLGSKAFRGCSNLWTVTMWVENPNDIEVAQDPFLLTPIEEQPTTARFNVPVNSLAYYRNHDVLGQYGRLTAMTDLPTIELVEGEPYVVVKEMEASVTYNRTFANTSWQALYVPFEMTGAEWSALGEVAEISGVHQYGDQTVIEFRKLSTSESVQPNTPYVFKVKAAYVNREISLADNATKMLLAAENGSVWCASTRNTYTMTGVYERTLIEDGYGIAEGTFQHVQNSTLKPYRFYLHVDYNDHGYGSGSSTEQNVPTRIGIMIDGEVTAIEDVEIDINTSRSQQYYDLLGRRVLMPKKGSMYIVNGKKVML